MFAIVFGALALTQPILQERDTTFSVEPGTSLSVNNERGETVITTWNQDRVRISAEFEDGRGSFSVRDRNGRLEVRGRSRRGPEEIEFQITVPVWMELDLVSTQGDITVDGSGAELELRTTHGDVDVRGGIGIIEIIATNGDITLEEANGRIVIQTMNGDIEVFDSEGTVSIQTTNGEIALSRTNATSIDVTTMNGDVDYDGLIDPSGTYSFSTHNGDVTIVLDSDANADITVSTVQGSFESDCPVRMSRTRSGGRQFDFEIGSGGARVEMESFGGSINVMSRGGCWGA
jgi:DUF4097 and DUF4098 domain-containing protein YvlB